jgi:MFS transporter, DHA1 family, tetracycline resistance protein
MIGERRALLFGGVVGVLAYVGYGSATEGWMIYVIVLAASIGGVAQPALQAIITKTVKPTEQGLVQGAMGSLQSLAQIAGPGIASAAFSYAVSEGARTPWDMPGLSFYVGAVLAACGLAVAWWVTRGVGRPSGASVS